MEKNSKEFLFTEAYRPQSISDCILPSTVKTNLETMVQSGVLGSMIFHGSAGTGKTTCALALAREMGLESILVNGSTENGIDVLRTKLTQFASSVSGNGKSKVIIIDEADGLTPQIQNGLKSFIEEYSSNVTFIFTCNNPKKIIPPIHSRCSVIDFKISKKEKPEILMNFTKRLESILKNEGIEHNREAVAKFIAKYFPDFRRVLNEVQRYSNNRDRKIDIGILGETDDEAIKVVIKFLKEKDFKTARQWVAQNSDLEIGTFYRMLYDGLIDKVREVPQMVLVIADYQYKASFSADVEINYAACMVELMSILTFKE